MKTYSTENIKVKIECFIVFSLKKEMSWDILNSIINNMTPTLDKSKEVIRILLDIIHDKEEPIDGRIENSDSNYKIELEEKVNDYVTNDCKFFQDKEQFLDRSIEVSKDSCIDFENKSQIEEVLLETPVEVSTDIQTAENLQDQFFSIT